MDRGEKKGCCAGACVKTNEAQVRVRNASANPQRDSVPLERAEGEIV